jgi:hypothetical protein
MAFLGKPFLGGAHYVSKQCKQPSFQCLKCSDGVYAGGSLLLHCQMLSAAGDGDGSANRTANRHANV